MTTPLDHAATFRASRHLNGFRILAIAGDEILWEGAAPSPTQWAAALFAERQADMRGAVNAQRDLVLAAGYAHDFGGPAGVHTLDTRNEADLNNWLGVDRMAERMIGAGAGAALMQIRDASDATFLASAADVSAAMLGMAQHRRAVMGRSWELKDLITAAADASALDAITITAGWPLPGAA